MTAISALYPSVRIEAPGVPEPLLQAVVRDTIVDFFRVSEAWRHTSPILLDWTTALPFPTIVAGTDIPTDTRLKRIDVVKYASDGTNLKTIGFSTRQQLDGQFPDWEVRTGSSPQKWTNDGLGAQPRIVPIADANVVGSIQVRSIVVPTSAATTVPDYFYDEYSGIWTDGALHSLLRMPGRDWTNPSLSAFYLTEYNAGIKMAKARAEAEYGQPDRVVQYGGI